MGILLTIGVLILIFVSVIMGFLILMQRSRDGGVGAAMGGGMAEATFGGETSSVLSKATIRSSVVFFVLAFVLYLGTLYVHYHGGNGPVAPVIAVPAMTAPAAASTPLPAMPAPAATQPATPPVSLPPSK